MHSNREKAMIKSLARLEALRCPRLILAFPAAAVAAAALAACGSSGATSGSSSGSSSPAAATSSALNTAQISGARVLTSAKGFTLYSFAPDTSTKSNCNGACAQNWPPVKGPATASGIKGTFGTIKRSDGSTQATFDGHPLYTFVGDTAPGQERGRRPVARGHHVRERTGWRLLIGLRWRHRVLTRPLEPAWRTGR
jgi:predicted lipoprotein with Yx(FWY)xxD motif